MIRAMQAFDADAVRRRPSLRRSAVRAVGSVVLVVAMVVAVVGAGATPASAQNVDAIIDALESNGWYIEPGGEGTSSGFDRLVDETRDADDEWYFVSLAGPVEADFADLLRDETRPTGNVLVYFFDDEGFVYVQLASDESESIEERALTAFDDPDWVLPDEFMDDVVVEFDRLTAGGGSSSDGGGDSGGGGLGWLFIAAPVAAIGGLWFFSARRKDKQADERALEMATKMRDAIQSELDELANDVLVLSGPVDLSEDDEAVRHYREAAATYTAISDEIPDIEQLEQADLAALHDLGARVSHARWQMDAAEAIIAGEPLPEKPEVEPPPAPPVVDTAPPPAPRMPQRQARPRVPYSRTRRRSGGGLLDILIAGGSMMGRRSSRGGFGGSPRSSGGMFGGTTRTSGRSTSPRPGGGVFGSGSASRAPSRRSTSRSRTRSTSRSRTRSRSSSSRRSTSRRRRR